MVPKYSCALVNLKTDVSTPRCLCHQTSFGLTCFQTEGKNVPLSDMTHPGKQHHPGAWENDCIKFYDHCSPRSRPKWRLLKNMWLQSNFGTRWPVLSPRKKSSPSLPHGKKTLFTCHTAEQVASVAARSHPLGSPKFDTITPNCAKRKIWVMCFSAPQNVFSL